jgi:hypothetical protein
MNNLKYYKYIQFAYKEKNEWKILRGKINFFLMNQYNKSPLTEIIVDVIYG